MSGIKSNTKVILEGRGTITLRPNDHIATGGEGSVYGAKNTVIKLYTDTSKMQRDGMPDKIKLLSELQHNYIVAPKNLVTDKNGKPIGYYMDHVDGEALSSVFTTSFRQREGFTDNDASILVDRMREAVGFAHSKNAIMVDANELNWLSVIKGKKGPEPRAIDVDSWAIGKYPATVIMPSIRDWNAKQFTELTDWFAWGIVTFQIFTGIHPYKGTLDGFKRSDLEGRMRANASVFTPEVKLNRAVRSFSTIPGSLLDWYSATFQHGERAMPPSPFDIGTAVTNTNRVMRRVTTATGSLSFDKLYGETGSSVIRIFHCGVVLLENGNLVDLSTRQTIGKVVSHNAEVIKADKGWLVADVVNAKSAFSYINQVNFKREELSFNLDLRQFVRYENRLFVVTEQGLTELLLKNFAKPLLVTGNTVGAMTNSTKWFDGVGIQDVMGAIYLVAVFSEDSFANVRVPELDGLKVISAKAGHRFITVVAVDKNGDYQKLEFTFNNTYKQYTLWKGATDSADLNISILPKQVCATIVEDGELNIFVPKNGTLKKVQDKHISTNMALANWEDKVVYIHDGAVWSVKLK